MSTKFIADKRFSASVSYCCIPGSMCTITQKLPAGEYYIKKVNKFSITLFEPYEYKGTSSKGKTTTKRTYFRISRKDIRKTISGDYSFI